MSIKVRPQSALFFALGLAAGIAIGALGSSRMPPAPAAAPAAVPSFPAHPERGDEVAESKDARRVARLDDGDIRPARTLRPGREIPPAAASSPAHPERGREAAGAKEPDPARPRASALQADAEAALAQGDGARALALLKDLAAQGGEGDQAAIELWRRLWRAVQDGKKLGVTSYDMRKVIQGQEFVPLLKRALIDPSADERFRAFAVDDLALSPNPDTLPFVLSLVEQEKDGRVLRQMLGFLEEQSDPAVGATLGRLLSTRTDPRERSEIVQALGDAAGEEALLALQRAADADPDPQVRAEAAVELIAKRPPVTGYLLSEVIDNSQASQAGLRPGDILLSYNGAPMGPEASLTQERDKVPKGTPVRVTVWRNGRQIDVTLKAGTLGVNGKPVAPRS